MRKGIATIALAAICCAGVSARAAELSLKQAVFTALSNNPEVAAADMDTLAVKAKIRQVRAQGRPQLNYEASYIHLEEAPNLSVDLGSYLKPAFNGIIQAIPNMWPAGQVPTYTNPPTTAPATVPVYSNPYKDYVRASINAADFSLHYPLSEQDMTRHTLTFQWPLLTSGRLANGTAAAKSAVTALESKANSKKNEIALSVIKAYLGVALAKRVAEVSDEAYKTVLEHEKQAESLFQQGMIAKYELMRAQTEVANQDRRRLDAVNQADLAMAFLQDVLGRPEDETPDLTDSLNGKEEFGLDYDQAVKTALEASNDMKALKARDRLYRFSERAARAENKPVVAAVASKDLYDNDLPLTTPGAFFGFVMKVPIFDAGASRAKAAEQSALRLRNATDIDRLTNGIRLEVRKYYLDLKSAGKALEAADKAVDLATESRRLATRRFEVGQGTSLEVMDSILALSIAETNREQARYQYDLAYYGLKKAMGLIMAEFQNAEVTAK